MAGPDPISQAVNVAATVATVVNNINDVNQRRTIQSNLALLSNDEQLALAKSIANQNDKNAQIQLLVSAVTTAQNAAADRAQKSTTVKWIVIGVAGIAVLFIIAWKLKHR